MGESTSHLRTAKADRLKRHSGFGTLEPMSSQGTREAGHAADSAPDRVEPAWRVWLEALATDAEAALGAALAYQTLDGNARNAVLDVLEEDSKRLQVPPIAVFAPLLSVERDEGRRNRIRMAMGDVDLEANVPARALMGQARDGDQIVVAETHAYLDFVRVTVCRLDPDHCVRWVRSEPLMHVRDALKAGTRLDGAELEAVPLNTAVDAIARAIVAQRRRDGSLPESLRPLLELFDARAREVEDAG